MKKEAHPLKRRAGECRWRGTSMEERAEAMRGLALRRWSMAGRGVGNAGPSLVVGFCLPEEMVERMTEAASKRSMTVSEWLRSVVSRALLGGGKK